MSAAVGLGVSNPSYAVMPSTMTSWSITLIWPAMIRDWASTGYGGQTIAETMKQFGIDKLGVASWRGDSPA